MVALDVLFMVLLIVGRKLVRQKIVDVPRILLIRRGASLRLRGLAFGEARALMPIRLLLTRLVRNRIGQREVMMSIRDVVFGSPLELAVS